MQALSDAGALMFAYLPVLLIAATPLVLGMIALLRGRREDIPAIMRALAQWWRPELGHLF